MTDLNYGKSKRNPRTLIGGIVGDIGALERVAGVLIMASVVVPGAAVVYFITSSPVDCLLFAVLFLVCGGDVVVVVELFWLGAFFVVSADEVVGSLVVEVDVEVVGSEVVRILDEVVGPRVVVDVVVLLVVGESEQVVVVGIIVLVVLVSVGAL